MEKKLESILIVDDEEVVREFLSDVLGFMGYKTYTCSDGLEGVNYYKNNHKTIDLVILDMVMPKKDGCDTFKEMKEINPDVKALISTGYSYNDRLNDAIDSGICGVLNKPYGPKTLYDMVESALGNKLNFEN